MKKKDIRKNLIPQDASVRDVLISLNKGIYGVVLLVDKKGKMDGLVTDGDVRRALLSGAQMDDPIAVHMNRKFTHGTTQNSHEQNIELLSERIRHLPVLDKAGRPVDLISWAEIWKLPVTRPYLGGNELKYVSDCIVSNWISSQGHYIKQFERMFAQYHKMKYTTASSSGTTALHLALTALGIGPGDEVIVPNITFAACANVVLHCGALPVFADVSVKTWTIDPLLLEALITDKTKAIMAVHLYGHPCDMDPIMKTAKKHNLYVVEDCAEALGARYKESLVGTIGDVSCFSFFANKVITTGEGGMVLTRNRRLNEKIGSLRDHGMSKTRKYWHDLPGFNYRMTNLQAAIGVAQMEKIDRFLESRRLLAAQYERCLSPIKGITLPPEENWAKNIYWLYSILIDETKLGLSAVDLMDIMKHEGIETRPFFSPLHLQPPYPRTRGRFPVSTRLAKQGISLPTGNDVTAEDAERVCKTLKKIVSNAKMFKKLGIHNAERKKR